MRSSEERGTKRERQKRAWKSGENGAQTSRPVSSGFMVSSSRRVQEEDVHVSSEGDEGQSTRPAEEEKGKETEVKGNMTTKEENSEEKEPRGR